MAAIGRRLARALLPPAACSTSGRSAARGGSSCAGAGWEVEAVVVGAGVVGCAVAAALARAGREVLLVERHGTLGYETSSRNSEGAGSSRLCSARRLLMRTQQPPTLPFPRTQPKRSKIALRRESAPSLVRCPSDTMAGHGAQ